MKQDSGFWGKHNKPTDPIHLGEASTRHTALASWLIYMRYMGDSTARRSFSFVDHAWVVILFFNSYMPSATRRKVY